MWSRLGILSLPVSLPLPCTLSLSQINEQWGACVLQPVKHPTPDFGSGHDLMVHEFEPHVGLCADGTELLGIPSFPVSLPLSPVHTHIHTHTHTRTHTLSLSLSQSLNTNKW